MEESRGSRGRRGVAFIAVVVVSLVAFASLGGVGLAQNAVGLVQYQYGKKVMICHKGKTIKISTRAWPAHKRHGDEVGTCAALKKKHANAKAHAKAKAHGKAAAAQSKQSKQGGHGKKLEPSSQPVAETTSDAGKGQGNKGQRGKGGGSNGKSQGGKHDD